jgi:hypothetical protein
MLRLKAEEIALKLNTELTPLNGWLDRFRKHAELSYKIMSGESKSVTVVEVGVWKGVLPSLLSEYHPKYIFSAGECRLIFKDENCRKGKRSKDRNTAFVSANMDGCEKMPLLLNGMSEMPRYFKHVKSLPCAYRYNSSTWITCVLFMESPTCLEGRMAAQNWKILLF